MQEVIRTPASAPDWLVYEDANRRLDQRAHLFAEISRRLPQSQSFFAPAARGPLAADKVEVWTEHGLGLWVADRFSVSGLSHGFVFGGFRGDGWGDEPVPRALQLARIALPDTNQTICVVNLHGIREPSGKGDTAARAQQCDRLIAEIEGFCDPSEPLIVTGDFNLLPDSATFAALRDIGLRDLVAEFGLTDTRTDLYKKSQRFADYTLVNTAVEVLAFEAPPQPLLSDHRPLILDFQV